MKAEEARKLRDALEVAGEIDPGESLLGHMLYMLNARRCSISEVAKDLGISRFKVVRYLERHGFKRIVSWMNCG